MNIAKLNSINNMNRSTTLAVENNTEAFWTASPNQKKKYIICLGDGMADYPIPDLGWRTPLSVANKPSLDQVAKMGISGMVRTIPENFSPGSDVANMSILGYDPKIYYTGRAPIEAASMNLEIPLNRIPFRCNFVTITNNIMQDFTAGHITNEEAKELINLLNDYWKNYAQFFAGVSYRNLVLMDEKYLDLHCTPPHDITGKDIRHYLPKGNEDLLLISMMQESQTIINSSVVNRNRISKGQIPVTDIWLWGQGRPKEFESFQHKYGLTGGIVTAVDLLKGIGKLIGFETPDIEGATGFVDTNYENKVAMAIKLLEEKDFVFLHVEAPDEAGHMGDFRLKIKAIEDFSEKVIGPLLEYQKKNPNLYLMVLPDHSTPCKIKTHFDEPVPFTLYYKEIIPDTLTTYNEDVAKKSKLIFNSGPELLAFFLKL